MNWEEFYNVTVNMKVSTTVSDRFSEYQSNLDDIKSSFSGPLSGIFKYLEKDVDTVINISLFDNKHQDIWQKDIDNVCTFISLSLARSIDLEYKIETDHILNTAQKKFLLHTLKHLQLWLKMMEYAVYIEAEKWWYILDAETKKQYLEKIEHYETLLYGPSIHNLQEEKTAVLHHIGDLYSRHSLSLSTEQEKLIQDFFSSYTFVPHKIEKETKTHSKSQKTISSDILSIILEKVYSIYGEDTVFIHESSTVQEPFFDENINTYLIPAWIHSKDLKQFFETHKISDKTKIILSDIATNFSVWRRKDEYFDDHTIKFPSKNTYSLDRVCQLIDHEVGTHFVRNKNSSLWIDIKSGWYLETEEGMATANEQLALWNRDDLQADEPTLHHLSTFIAEQYDATTTEKLLEILFVLQWEKTEKARKLAHDRMLRVKRFHSFDLPWANRKDVVYRRGMRSVIEYLKNADVSKLKKDTKLLYSWKFSDKDMDYIDGLFDWLDIDTDKYISPLALGKMICHKYTGNVVDRETLAHKDMRFDSPLAELNYTQKKKLIEILDILQKD